MQEIGFSYIPENFYDSNNEEKEGKKEEEEKEEKEAKEQKEILIKNVVNVLNIIKMKDKEEEEEFKPGIINNRYDKFCDYRTKFQNRYFHPLEHDILDDTKRLLDSSFLPLEKNSSHLLKYDQIELADISTNLNNSNYDESYNKVNNILEDLLVNFASLKSLQSERIKPKFIDEQKENRRIEQEIQKLIIQMMKKIKFCEGLTKMEKIFNNKKNGDKIDQKVKNNIKDFLVSKIKNFSNEFRRNQQQYMKYLKEMEGGDIENNNDILNHSFESLDDNEEENLNNNNFLMKQDDDFQQQMKKRNEDINALANSINELSGIFKDLQNVVQEQGTILDRIDYNIDVSYENSQKGLKFLKKAEEHQSESCFRNVILVLFVIIFIETLLIIFKVF